MTGTFDVRIGPDAERDLESIYEYLALNRSKDDADALVLSLFEKAQSLRQFAKRGARPQELEGHGCDEYHQILHGRYRLIYSVIGDQVTLAVIADGRRDMRALLQRRLLDR